LIHAADRVAARLGAETSVVDLGKYNLPVYSQDDESANGLPQGAIDLKQALSDADGWIVSTPEYNGFPSPLLLNAYTWCSRGDPEGKMYATFSGKTALVLSASPGAMGGMRTLNPHRQLLMNLGVNVVSNSVAVGGAFKAFDELGDLVDEKHRTMLQSAVETLFFKARDDANRELACALIQKHVGEYGSVDVPGVA
jgi:NAD(P)H-dependent FMN reductase